MGVGTGTGSYWYQHSQYQLRATENKSESALRSGPQSRKIFLGPALLGTFVLPLSRSAYLSEAPEGAPLRTLWASLPRVPSEEALPSGVRVAAPPGLPGGSCWPLSPAHCPT